MNVTTTLIEFLIILFAHAAAGMFSTRLKYSSKVTYAIWGTWIVAQGTILYITEFVLNDIALQFLMGFLAALIGQYVLFFLTTKGRLAQRVFILLTYSIFFCIFMSFYTAVSGTFPGMNTAMRTLIHILMISAVVMYFLRYVCPLCHEAGPSIGKGWYILIFVNVIFFITVIALSIFPVRLASFSDIAFVPFVFLSISIFAVYPVIFANIRNMAEVAKKRDIEQQNRLLIAQIEKENLQKSIEQKARHDRRHHNLFLLELANRNDIESVKEYLGKLVENDNAAHDEIRYCGNVTINTVLSVYEKSAKEDGIKVNISANATNELPMQAQDLVIIIANLFENAINACTKVRTDEKAIDISIRQSEKRLLIKVENTCRPNLVFDETYYGIGISSIISTTEKYEGMYDFSAEEGIFVAKLSLYLRPSEN